MDRIPNRRMERLSPQDFEALKKRSDTALSQADRVLQDAKAEAERIIDEARTASAAQHKKLTELSKAELRQFIDEDAIRRHAQSFVALLTEINRIKRNYASLTPWLIDLVETAVHKILGEIDVAEQTARIVGQAASELSMSHELTLRIAPEDHDKVMEARKRYPSLMGAISEVISDAGVPPEQMTLQCQAGEVTTSVTAHISAILGLLASRLGDPLPENAT